MKVKFLTVIMMIFAVFLFSCENSSTSTSSKKKNPFDDESDRVIKTGPLEVNEAKIYISYESDKYFLNIPVKLESGSSSINAEISVNVNKLDGTAMDSLSRSQSETVTS